MSNESHRALRDVLGQFATGVCLVTVRSEAGRALALTVNSFAAVSLDPPLVLWSLQNDSELYAEFAGARRYAINVLASAQEEHSSRYAMKGGHELDPAHFAWGRNGAPAVRDALAVFECSLEASYPGGDHVILVGRVTHFDGSAGGEPLLFFGGAYRRLGGSEPA
jgi:flavin reductase (DIM6/NTAB) family NADH-FMN oxidoreductase RutF